jgi:F0F1-type ATP synthase membrane subunit b/b'
MIPEQPIINVYFESPKPQAVEPVVTNKVLKWFKDNGEVVGSVVVITVVLLFFLRLWHVSHITNSVDESINEIKQQFEAWSAAAKEAHTETENIKDDYDLLNHYLLLLDTCLECSRSLSSTLDNMDTKKYPKNIQQAINNCIKTEKELILKLQSTKQTLSEAKYSLKNNIDFRSKREKQKDIFFSAINEWASLRSFIDNLAKKNNEYRKTWWMFWLLLS